MKKPIIRSIDPKQINVDPIGLYPKTRMESVNKEGKKLFTKMIAVYMEDRIKGVSTNEGLSTIVSMMANSIVFETFRANDTLKEAKRFQKLYLKTLKENDKLYVRISKLTKKMKQTIWSKIVNFFKTHTRSYKGGIRG